MEYVQDYEGYNEAGRRGNVERASLMYAGLVP